VMGAKQSAQTSGTRLVSQQSGQFESASGTAEGINDDDLQSNGLLEPPGGRSRARSMGSVPNSSHNAGAENGQPIGIPGAPGAGIATSLRAPSSTVQPNTSGHSQNEEGAYGQAAAGAELTSETSTPEELSLPVSGRVFHAQSLPVHLLSLPGYYMVNFNMYK
jgi:hypothetical protein